MNRTQAIKTLRKNELRTMLSDYGLTLLSANMDEAAMEHKDIHTVMGTQKDLVNILAPSSYLLLDITRY